VLGAVSVIGGMVAVAAGLMMPTEEKHGRWQWPVQAWSGNFVWWSWPKSLTRRCRWRINCSTSLRNLLLPNTRPPGPRHRRECRSCGRGRFQ